MCNAICAEDDEFNATYEPIWNNIRIHLVTAHLYGVGKADFSFHMLPVGPIRRIPTGYANSGKFTWYEHNAFDYDCLKNANDKLNSIHKFEVIK